MAERWSDLRRGGKGQWRLVLLLIILLLAGTLRVYRLGEIPPSLTWDEAAWGYNAYSLGLDGRDEFGRFLPIDYLESFGDFKPPSYAYLTILPVKIFGLNEFAVRLPSALLGTLTVLATYFLVGELFGEKDIKKGEIKKLREKKRNIIYISTQYLNILPLISALFLAISPWHINLSRAAFEANAAQFFLVSGVWLFLRWANSSSSRSLLLFVFCFLLSLYTFNTARVVAPLLMFVLVFGFRRKVWEMKREFIAMGTIGLIFALPWLNFIVTPQARLRFHETNIFSDLSIIERTNQEIANDGGTLWSRIIHNRRLAYGVEYLKHYLDHFNPEFLFIKGDGNPKFSTQDVGELYLWDLPFLLIGVLVLLRLRPGYWWILPAWLLLGIVPAATARETPHALRIETTLPIWQIITATGFVAASSKFPSSPRLRWAGKVQSSKLQTKFKNYGFYLIFGSLLVVSVVYYLHGYYRHYSFEFSREWQYGYREMIAYVKSLEDQYDKVVITDALGRPYAYFLFYTKENPEFFRQTADVEREVFGFVNVNSYGKYVFSRAPNDERMEGRVLFINVPERVPEAAWVLKTFSLLNGEPVLVAYEK